MTATVLTPDIWRMSAPVPVVPKPSKPERTATPAEYATIADALAAIPNDDLPYDEWFKIACAVHYATQGEGLELFREWSASSAKHDDEFLDNRVWPYIQTERGGELITERTLFTMAAQHGWQDPTIADDFDVVEDPVDDFQALPAEDKPPRFTVLREDEFLNAPPVSWLVKGVLPRAEVGTLYGEPASGKSFMALDIAAAIARGIDWRGHKVKQGRVVYVAAEGAAGFRNRLRAYRHQHGLRAIGVEVIANAPNLLEKADALDVSRAILQRGKADLVIIDTLAQSMPGGNENSGEDMGRLLAHCRGIHRATGAMVLLVHHSGKDAAKGARGWSGLRAACDVELEVVRADDDRVLTVTKQKDGEDGAEFGFRLETVLLDFDVDGDEVTSCVVTHGDASAAVKGRRRQKPLGEVEKVVVKTMEDMAGLGEDALPKDKVIDAAREALTPPDTGHRDTRAQRVARAFTTLEARGMVEVGPDTVKLSVR